MEDMIKQQSSKDVSTEQTDNDILNNLDKYLNGKFEEDFYDETELITQQSFPSPIFQDGKWKVPGTNKLFNTQSEAYKAIQRYTKYVEQDNAARLIYGIDYEEYIYGESDEQKNNKIDDSAKQPEFPKDGQGDFERIKQTS